MIAFSQEDNPAFFTFEPRPDQPDRFDQQTAFYHSSAEGVSWMIGGNGAGTTAVALAKVAKFLLCDQPPPRYDTPFWIISDSYEVVCETAWKEKLFGHGHIPAAEVDWERVSWLKPNRQWPFAVPLKPWPGRPGRNWCLEFKSYKQGRNQMQARAIGGFLFIEQFPWGLLEEVIARCREYNFPGSKLCEFTPVDPDLSVEIEEMLEQDKLPDGWEVYRANTQCAMEAGHVSPSWFNEFFGMVSDEMRETRLTGAFASYEGAIYKSFHPLIHLVGDETITFPPNSHYRRAIDWGGGPSNAFVCLWAYRNGRGQWFVFDEYYSTDQSMTTVDHLCEVVDRHHWPENNPHYGTTYADPSDPSNLRIAAKLSTYAPARKNIWITPAANSVHEGIEHVRWLLKPDPALMGPSPSKSPTQSPSSPEMVPQPRLFIHRENCPQLARQMRTYRWMKPQEMGLNPRDARKEPLKKDDHAVDALRYLTYSEAVTTGATPHAIARENRAERLGVHLKGRGRDEFDALFERFGKGRKVQA